MIIFCKTSEGTFMVDGITSLFYQQMTTDDDQRKRIQRLYKFVEKKVKDFRKLKDDEEAFKMLISEIVEEYEEELKEMEGKDIWAAIEEKVKDWADKVPDEIHYFWDELLSGEASVIEVEYRRYDGSLGKLVTTYDVFICNDEGKTIHHLSPWKES